MSQEGFKIHSLDGYIETIFIAEYENKLLLIDGGCAGDAKRIEDFITISLKRSISDLKLMIVSHIHPDHAGGAPKLREKYGIPIAAPSNLNQWYKGPCGFIQHRVDMMLGQWVAKTNNTPREKIYYNRKVPIDIHLNDGTKLPEFSDWAVYTAPGHTTHDIVLFNAEASLLYAADVILCVKNKFITPFPVPMPELMKATLNKISSFEVETLLLAHGGEIPITKKMDTITKPLINSFDKETTGLFKMLIPLSKFSPEIRRAG